MITEFKHLKPVHEDDRRKLLEIINGKIIKQIKIIHVKKASILGNHYHNFGQFFFILKGKATYIIEDIETKEKIIYNLKEGDFLSIKPKIAHKAIMDKGVITIEGNEEEYTGPECDIKYEINDN